MIPLHSRLLEVVGTCWRHVGGTTSEPVPHHFLVKKFLSLENEQTFHQHSLEAAGVRNPHCLDDSLKNVLNDPCVLISRGILKTNQKFCMRERRLAYSGALLDQVSTYAKRGMM